MPGTPPLKPSFPHRNRLISALAKGVLVVEAALGSGSLITARCAAEQGRDVFAIPGSINSPFSKGCHKLIKEGAKLVDTVQDVLDELQIEAATTAAPLIGRQPRRGSEERAVLDALGFDSLSADQLVARLTWPVERVMTHLLTLEIAGAIAQLPGGSFQRLR